MLEPFTLPFVQRGVAEVLILAVPAGLLGSWIVLRGLAFFTHALGTAAFPGLVLAAGLGFSGPLGALAAAGAFTGLVLVPSRRGGESYDSLTAMALVASLALGVVLASDVFHSGSDIETLLFGGILLIDGPDLRLAAAVALVTVAVSALVDSRWLARGFDPEAARALGSGSALLELCLLGLLAIAATAALSAVGALLVSSLFVLPAATARLLSDRVRTIQLLSVGLCAVEGVAGMWLCVKTDAPPGATIAVTSGAVFALVASSRVVSRRGPAVPA
jgi:ABC-type Mn2+/Zn2+ transport system permease subunit